MYNAHLLGVCIAIAIGLVLSLFYFNRILGYIIGFIFRAVNWNWSNESSSIWVEIGSVHFSVLGGRVLLKDVRYHSSNQTIKVVKAQVVWRYWIRQPATEDDLGQARVGSEDKGNRQTRLCRIQVSLDGVQWDLYNRTAAYDDIVAKMDATITRSSSRVQSRDARHISTLPTARLSRLFALHFGTDGIVRRIIYWFDRQLPKFDPNALLPVGIQVTKGAITCGNPSTRSLLVSEFQRAEGTFGIVQSRSKYDLYKQMLNLKLDNVLIRLLENDAYEEAMVTIGEDIQERLLRTTYLDRYLTFSSFPKIWRKFQLYALFLKGQFRDNNIPSKPTSKAQSKRRKNAEEETPIGPSSATLEYAIERQILETPQLELLYYIDVVGDVPPEQDQMKHIMSDVCDIGNGDFAPEWGIDVVIRNGFLRYGPWADRQRAELQRIFFPATFSDAQVTPHLQPGDKRLWTAFKVFIELREDTTLYIPFREPSKNWQWDGIGDLPPRSRKRESGSFHVTAGDSSSISYFVPMIAQAAGYESRLEVHLDDIAVTSSLNDIRVLTAQSCRVRGELPTPLKWDAQREWIIAISLRQPIIYLLRDHMTMLSDLGRDWASGPPADYYRFMPVIYKFELDLYHFNVNLYVNDHNIIDKPLTRDENAIFTLQGTTCKSHIRMPANVFRPEQTCVSFSMEVPDGSLFLSVPRWNTHCLRNSVVGNLIGRAGLLRICGTFQYYTEIREQFVDQLNLSISTSNVCYKAFGWSIRYFFILRDNYLGSFTHFRTLYEYIDNKRRGLSPGDPIKQKYREGSSNTLNVELSLDVQNGHIMLPGAFTHYYDHTGDVQDILNGPSVVAVIPRLTVSMRSHAFFMDLSVNVDEVRGFIEPEFPDARFFNSQGFLAKQKTFIIDGIHITANRLFGPLPETATYFCTWEISIGDVKAALSVLQTKILLAAVSTFGIGLSDPVNAPAAEYAVPYGPDVTFLKFSLDSLEAMVLLDTTKFSMSFPQGLRFDSNDLAGPFCRDTVSVRLPSGVVRALLSERQTLFEAARLEFDCNLDIYSRPEGWQESAHRQKEFIETQDRITGRARRFIESIGNKGAHVSRYGTHGKTLHINGLYLPQPQLCGTVVAPRLSQPQTLYRRQTERRDRQGTSRSRLSHSSDEETGVSEADRDARLARSRSLTQTVPIIQSDFEDNMISGDESDTEDLTDQETSDSELSESGHDGNIPSVRSSLTSYRPWMDRYVPSNLKDPSLWDRSGCVLVHISQSVPLSELSSECNTFDESKAHEPLSFHIDDGINASIYRFRICRKLDLKVLPPVLTVFTLLEEAIEETDLGPELMVDSLIASYLSTFPAAEGDHHVILDAQLASVNAQLFRRLPLLAEGDTLILDDGNGPLGMRRSIPILISLSARELRIVSSIHPRVSAAKESQASIRFDKLVIALNSWSAHSEDAPKTAWNLDDVALKFSASNGSCDLSSRAVIASISTVDLSCAHRGPELVAAAGIVVDKDTRQLLSIYEKWQARNTASLQFVVYRILKSPGVESVLDPLSTIQPSYLVQNGRPYQLRGSTNFRFLIHLRYCLQSMHEGTRSEIRYRPRAMVNLKELRHLIDSRLTALAVDADASNAAHLEALFPGIWPSVHKDQVMSTDAVLSSITLEINSLKISVSSTSDERSELEVTGLTILGRRRDTTFTQNCTPNPMLSQTSLKERDARFVRSLSVSSCLGDVTLSVLPHLMTFAQQLLHVQRHYAAIIRPVHRSLSTKPLAVTSQTVAGNITLSLNSFRVRAAAQKLTFELGAAATTITTSVLIGSTSVVSGHPAHLAITFGDVFLRARATSEAPIENSLDILASLDFTRGSLSLLSREEAARMAFKIVGSVGKVHLSVPRSAIRLYHFIEEWRAHFWPGTEVALRAFLSELQHVPSKGNSEAKVSTIQKGQPLLHIDIAVDSLGFSLQVMHGTWLSWEARHILIYVKSKEVLSSQLLQSFGVKVDSQLGTVTAKSDQDYNPSTRLKLPIPTITIAGHYDGYRVHGLMSVDSFHVRVRPSHWDTLLSVQQKFGQDFNDLVAIIQETSRKKSLRQARPSSSPSLKYNVHLKVRGFSVGLAGLSSTLYLDCGDIGGGIQRETGLTWTIHLSNLALSLASRAVGDNSEFIRNHRSVFVIIDLRTIGGSKSMPEECKDLRIDVTKVHAVMRPSSIGEIGDYIDDLQVELLERKEQRVLQLQAFKDKTKNIMKTFEVKVKEDQSEETIPWWNQYTIDLHIANIGVAFPLALDQDIELPARNSQPASHDPNMRDSSAVQAFLISVQSITFGTQRGENGQAKMERFSFQFVGRFRQWHQSDFSGENHQSRNRLVYPEVTAQLRTEGSAFRRHIRVLATISGFILDLDSCVPEYVFSLIDVYRQGTERMNRLAARIPRESLPSPAARKFGANTDGTNSSTSTSNIFASMTFLSGTVHLYSGQGSKPLRPLAAHLREIGDEPFSDGSIQTLRLPVVSVWAEYRATPVVRGTGAHMEPSVLMFKSTIHSSRNVLRPAMLPFLIETVSHIEERMRKVSYSSSPHPVSIIQNIPVSDQAIAESSLQINFSLRIDQSKLELTCQPDVNVIAGLYWESGGFLVNVSPGARKVTFTGSVGGLTMGLRHGFLSDDCVNLNARNLAFSASFAKILVNDNPVSLISVVVDTEIFGGVRFSRLQDVLCFKAVWLDRIPIFTAQNVPSSTASRLSDQSEAGGSPEKQDFSTVLLVRIREIRLDADLGQSISAITLNLENTLIRTKLTDPLYELSLFVQDVSFSAKGNISGCGKVPNCVFQTVRRREGLSTGHASTKMLELTLTSGSLEFVLDSDHQQLLQYRAEPLHVEIFDDWSAITANLSSEERLLHLSFTVSGSEVTAVATVSTIPKLIAYATKFRNNLDGQREGAARESDAFRISFSPKPENALSEVANAMINSARNRFKEADTWLSYMIRQHMSLRLNLLRLVVFPRSMGDFEMAQFIGRDVHARLDRTVQTDASAAKRELRLDLSAMTISKFSQLNHILAASSPTVVSRLISLLQDSTEANIVGLPSMTIRMKSEQVIGNHAKVLVYDFESHFKRTSGHKKLEDIYITLNMSLYSWLTILKKNLTRELDQALSVPDSRTSLSSVSSRRRPPETVLVPQSDSSTRSTVHPKIPDSGLSLAAPPMRRASRSTGSILPPIVSSSERMSSDHPVTPTSLAVSMTAKIPPSLKSPSSSNISAPSFPIPPVMPPQPANAFNITYQPRHRIIERLTLRQLGEATPDVMHPFFMKKAGFNLEDSLPQYVHEYATIPLEEIMEVLLKLYSRQLLKKELQVVKETESS